MTAREETDSLCRITTYPESHRRADGLTRLWELPTPAVEVMARWTNGGVRVMVEDNGKEQTRAELCKR
ncbi:MAG: hypothetical protein DME19_04795 [Verrucomicrobia bacterium]|nr:MAG: hypothetical protein DME19_04795 [Verrucomicrobiota bacterium]